LKVPSPAIGLQVKPKKIKGRDFSEAALPKEHQLEPKELKPDTKEKKPLDEPPNPEKVLS